MVLVLSVLANVPCYWSIFALAAWAAVGHLVTLDDDQPGGWSNPEGDTDLWRSSLRGLAVKFAVFAALLGLGMAFPALRRYGG